MSMVSTRMASVRDLPNPDFLKTLRILVLCSYNNLGPNLMLSAFLYLCFYHEAEEWQDDGAPVNPEEKRPENSQRKSSGNARPVAK